MNENYPLLIGFDHYDCSYKYASTLDSYLLFLIRGYINVGLRSDLDKHLMELLEDEWFYQWPLVRWDYASRLLRGCGCKKNVKRAVNILLPMAEKESPGAMYDIGYCYMNGLGLEKSYSKAIYYWIKASAAGLGGAKQDLKTTYFYGNCEDYKGLPPELRLYFVYEVINIYMEEKDAMTLYDLLCSGHRVWQVYDCFYSTGDEDQELFEYMISNGVKINFEEFLSMYWDI